MPDRFDTPDIPPADDLVTIATLDNQAEFLVIRGLLESAGSDCYSPSQDEYRVKGRGPLYSTGIPLQVLASQAEDAVALLKDAEAHSAGTDEPDEDDQR